MARPHAAALAIVDWIGDHPLASAFMTGMAVAAGWALARGGLPANEAPLAVICGIGAWAIIILACIAIDGSD